MSKTGAFDSVLRRLQTILEHQSKNGVSFSEDQLDAIVKDVNRGVAPEWAVAQAKKLDLSEQGVEARAVEQGFTTPAYHGTMGPDFDVFDTDSPPVPGRNKSLNSMVATHGSYDPSIANSGEFFGLNASRQYGKTWEEFSDIEDDLARESGNPFNSVRDIYEHGMRTEKIIPGEGSRILPLLVRGEIEDVPQGKLINEYREKDGFVSTEAQHELANNEQWPYSIKHDTDAMDDFFAKEVLSEFRANPEAAAILSGSGINIKTKAGRVEAAKLLVSRLGNPLSKRDKVYRYVNTDYGEVDPYAGSFHSYAIPNEANIRSRFAVFDPDNLGLKTLLGGSAALSAMDPDQLLDLLVSEYGEPGKKED